MLDCDCISYPCFRRWLEELFVGSTEAGVLYCVVSLTLNSRTEREVMLFLAVSSCKQPVLCCSNIHPVIVKLTPENVQRRVTFSTQLTAQAGNLSEPWETSLILALTLNEPIHWGARRTSCWKPSHVREVWLPLLGGLLPQNNSAKQKRLYPREL